MENVYMPGRILKEEANSYLSEVLAEYSFRCCDVSVFRNIKELRDGLANMSDDTYACHFNSARNNFSQWVRDIIKDEKLAFDLQRSTSREEATRRTGTRVMSLSRRTTS